MTTYGSNILINIGSGNYLNQYWPIVNCTLGNNCQGNFYQIHTHENAFETIGCITASIGVEII